MLLRLLLGASFSALLHFYVWQRLVRGSELPRRVRRVLTGLMIAMFLAIPLTTSSRLWAPSLASTLGWIAMPWMAFVGLAVVTLLAIDAARFLGWLGRTTLRRP